MNKVDIKFSLDMKTLYILDYGNDTIYEYHLERPSDVLAWDNIPPVIRVGKIELLDKPPQFTPSKCKKEKIESILRKISEYLIIAFTVIIYWLTICTMITILLWWLNILG